MSDHKTATIIKILQDGNAGFQLIPTYPFAVIDVVAATADKGPFVCIGGRGDRNDQYYQVTGDVTIMNVAGDILSEVSYDKLMAAVRANALAKDTCDQIREAAGLDKPPAVWYASASEQARPSLPPGGAIQGTEGQQFWNVTKEDAHFDRGYNYDLFAELFGPALPVVTLALAASYRNRPTAKYKIYHQANPTNNGVVGYLEADKQMIFVIRKNNVRDLVDLTHSQLASYSLVKTDGRIKLQSGEGITAFTTPRCGNGFTPLKTEVAPDDYAGAAVIDNAVSTAIETRYTEPGSGMKFIPSEGFDLMDKLIPRGYGPCFSQLFTWMAEAGSTDVWLLFLSTVERDNDDVRGVIEVADLPFIVASKQGPKLVANLTDAEKEKYGLEYQPIIGWKTKDYNHRQMFIVRLIDKKIWDIGLPTAS